MVQNATAQKAPTELFIRKFAKFTHQLLVLLAVLITVVPYFLLMITCSVNGYTEHWFFVISCPCALVISIPLGYFGGIGAASKMEFYLKEVIFRRHR